MNRTETFNAAEAEIVAVIEAESAAWLRGDFELWRTFWVQDAHALHVSARLSLGSWSLRGFDEISEFFRPEFVKTAKEGGASAGMNYEAWQITVGADMAWATYDQVRSTHANEHRAPGRSNEMRILEKLDGQWKIAAVFHAPNRIGYYTAPWVRVDAAGRVIEMGPRAEAVLAGHGALQLVGRRLCGRRPTVQARLAAALAEADRHIVRRTGRTPFQLVLSEVGDEVVSLCWIVTADMMIVVLLADESLLAEVIERAGQVYGLSPAQMRVALGIARGQDLTAVARSLQVQPNTVRTHVRRMFERVEVNSQPALVRALLSVDAPYPSRVAMETWG